MINYFLVGGDIFIDSETFLMTDFINFKIKSTQSLKNDYRSKMYVYIFIKMSAHTYTSIYIYTIFLKKRKISSAHPT
jgi:hypothetical protein